MPDIGEIIEALKIAESELAVWRYIVRVLADMGPRDSGADPDPILTDDGVAVGQETIQSVHDEILDIHVRPLAKVTSKIKKLEIATSTDEEAPEDTEK